MLDCPLHLERCVLMVAALGYPTTSIEDLVSLIDHVPLENKLKPFFDVVVNNTIWSLWNYIKKVLFNPRRPKQELILNEIKTT